MPGPLLQGVREGVRQPRLPRRRVLFDWYDNGGPTSTSYSPRGKPAEQVMREYLKHHANIAEAVVGSGKVRKGRVAPVWRGLLGSGGGKPVAMLGRRGWVGPGAQTCAPMEPQGTGRAADATGRCVRGEELPTNVVASMRRTNSPGTYPPPSLEHCDRQPFPDPNDPRRAGGTRTIPTWLRQRQTRARWPGTHRPQRPTTRLPEARAAVTMEGPFGCDAMDRRAPRLAFSILLALSGAIASASAQIGRCGGSTAGAERRGRRRGRRSSRTRPTMRRVTEGTSLGMPRGSCCRSAAPTIRTR